MTITASLRSPWSFKQFPERQSLIDEVNAFSRDILSEQLISINDEAQTLMLSAAFGNWDALIKFGFLESDANKLLQSFEEKFTIGKNKKTKFTLSLFEYDENPVISSSYFTKFGEGGFGIFPDAALYDKIDITKKNKIVKTNKNNTIKNKSGSGKWVTLLGGDDKYTGGASWDDVYAGDGDDVVIGKKGNDNLDGGNGNDKLIGNRGNDLLGGFAGNDRLIGGNGDDFLDGGVGKDRLNGGSGDDWLVGGEGVDKIKGGAGNDVFYLVKGEGFDVIKDFKKGEDEIQFKKRFNGISLQSVNNDAWIYKGNDLLAKVLGAADVLEVGAGIIA